MPMGNSNYLIKNIILKAIILIMLMVKLPDKKQPLDLISFVILSRFNDFAIWDHDPLQSDMTACSYI